MCASRCGLRTDRVRLPVDQGGRISKPEGPQTLKSRTALPEGLSPKGATSHSPGRRPADLNGGPSAWV
jgi:hypothetical protein